VKINRLLKIIKNHSLRTNGCVSYLSYASNILVYSEISARKKGTLPSAFSSAGAAASSFASLLLKIKI
jgi:hypothetical protein